SPSPSPTPSSSTSTSTSPIQRFELDATPFGGHKWLIGAGDSVRGWGAGPDFALYDITAGTIPLAITPAGNVGIGNVAPAFQLDVSGPFAAKSVNVTTVNPPASGFGFSLASYTSGPALETSIWSHGAKLNNSNSSNPHCPAHRLVFNDQNVELC